MKRIAWVTDIHLNFLSQERVGSFIHGIARSHPDALLVGGDIGEAPNVGAYLSLLERLLPCPIYFVLGNHDFYQGSIGKVRAEIADLAGRSSRLTWLPAAGVLELTAHTGLIGHDGWGDGRLGDYAHTEVMLNDFLMIEELTLLDREKRLARLNALGDEAANHFRTVLPEALDRFGHLVALVHVPPFEAACWHKGKISDRDWLPYFTCDAVGRTMIEFMQRRSDRRMTVLCGHTHGSGEAQILPNLFVRTGGAVYGRPGLQEPLLIE